MKLLIAMSFLLLSGQVLANYQMHRPCVKWGTVEDASGERAYQCIKRGPAVPVMKSKCTDWGTYEDMSGERVYGCVSYTKEKYPVPAKAKCVKWGNYEDISGERVYGCIKRAGE